MRLDILACGKAYIFRMKLSDCTLNRQAIIKSVDVENKDYLLRLYYLGLYKGVKVRLEYLLKNKKACVISFNGKAVILSSEITDYIEVLCDG